MALSFTHRIGSSREIGEILQLGRRKKLSLISFARLVVPKKPWGVVIRVPAKTIPTAVKRNLIRRKINAMIAQIAKEKNIPNGLRVVCTVSSKDILKQKRENVFEEIKMAIQ